MPQEDRLDRRLGPEFDDNGFRWTRMIDWAADSDPKWMTTGIGWIMDSDWAGEPNST